MKQVEKNNYERIKEKIRKETGYLLKNLNKKNIKRELESFIYTIANCYNDSWTVLYYLDEIETEHASCIKSDSNTEIVFKTGSIIEDIFQAEAKEYADSLEGILKLAINNNQIFKVLKADMPSLVEIKEIFKNYKTKQLDFESIYENLSCFYLDYNYNGNIKDFIKCSNAELKEIVDNKKILEEGNFLTINIPIYGDEKNSITAMYIGKDKEGRYNFTDNSRFIFSKEFIEKGENILRNSVDENFTREIYKISESTMKSWGVIKEGTENHDSTVYFMFKEGVQNQLYALNYNDPVTMLLDLKIDFFGKLELRKLNTNGDLIDGAIFNVKGDNYNQDVVVINGKIN